MSIDLADPLALPSEFVKRLEAIESDCLACDSFDQLLELDGVRLLVKDINSYCMGKKIVGIHYTRAIASDIEQNGLLIRDGEKIREDFLVAHGHIFTDEEVLNIKKEWSEYFSTAQSSARDARIFFNFSEGALSDGGAERLISMSGGEQLFMPFELDDSIGLKLSTIGEPLLIRCSLDPSKIHTFIQHPWGRILVSAYQTLINSKAKGVDQDGYYESRPVLPQEIIEIQRLEDF